MQTKLERYSWDELKKEIDQNPNVFAPFLIQEQNP